MRSAWWPAVLIAVASTWAVLAQAPAGSPGGATAAGNAAADATSPTGSSTAATATFAEWLSGIRTEALARGIRAEVVTAALAGVTEPLDVVIERDRTQAETVLPLETYLARQVTAARVRTGRQMLVRHGTMLNKVAAAYGVPASVIVSVWGAESNFGRFTGVRPIIEALATLAWDPRRSALFRGELFNALEILNRGDIDLARMKGSWAGAMGQLQFMPSSYLQYAVDFDGDGTRDIWSSTPDVFASIGNYLKGNGWEPGRLWGREVRVSAAAAARIAAEVGPRTASGSCRASRQMTEALPLDRWQALGVRTVNGGRLPIADVTASLVSGASRHFLVYDNYHALLAYNCAHPYALGVALFADRLR
jgi:membrane-bound lytic murein transglycosylase B